MDNLRTATDATVSCNGFNWITRGCGEGPEIGVGAATTSCVCDNGNYTLRPQLGFSSPNWGGINGVTCNPPTQVMSFSYTATDPLVVTTATDTKTIGSLRYAITHANANPGDDAITFNIPGSGPHVITLAGALPAIADDGVSIDGTTQAGAGCGDLWAGKPHTLQVQVDGNGSGTVFDVASDNVQISGLSLVNAGIFVRSRATADSTQVQCSFVGLQTDGTADGSSDAAIWIDGSNTLIGGANAGEGNVVSGNAGGISSRDGASGLSVIGNFVGTDPTGSSPRANNVYGISHWSGTASWVEIRRNLIAGNLSHGVFARSGSALSGSSGDLLIRGNHIGVNRAGTAALANGGDGVRLENGTISGVTIGGTSASDRNVISGNGDDAIELVGVSDIDIFGNYIGLNAAGTSALGNTSEGIVVAGVNGLNIGNGTASGRNVLGGNVRGRQIRFEVAASSNIGIRGNHIGTDSTGNAAIDNGSDDGYEDAIQVDVAIDTADIVGNVLGGHSDTLIEIWQATSNVTIQGNNFNVGADGTSDISHPSAVPGFAAAIHARNTQTNLLIGGTGAGEGNLIANGAGAGVTAWAAGSTSIVGNTIRNNAGDGISLESTTSTAAIYANAIYGNGGLGIDLIGINGVNGNDGGDGDTGPNDLLNFPVINAFTADGTTAVGFDINLDVPSNGNGYRIDFFKNTAADATGYGEGEIHLGSVDVSHPGGNLQFVSSFTANTGVSAGDIISATATRKTGGASYDITSEFSQAATATSAADPLVVTSTADTNTLGTLRYAINHANANTGDDAITFNVAGGGPHTITLGSALPTITDDGISIDGTTQSGAACGDLWAGTPHTLQIRIDSGSATDPGYRALTIGASTVTLKGLSVTRFAGAVSIDGGADTVSIACNYFGLTPANGYAGIFTTAVEISGSNATIGGSGSGDGNVIAGLGIGIGTVAGSGRTDIIGNFIGTDATGTVAMGSGNAWAAINHYSGAGIWGEIRNNLIAGSGFRRGIAVEADDTVSGPGGGDVVIAGNRIGTTRAGTTALAVTGNGITFADGSISGVRIGGTVAADRNVIAANGNHGIRLGSVSDITILGNYIGVGADGSTALGNTASGISSDAATGISLGNGTAAGANVIAHNGAAGIALAQTTARAAIVGNAIYGNGGLGIDLGTTGATPNDSGDGDSGANDLLNFPVINSFATDGTTAVDFDINLDVPSNGNGYRIDFFKNSTADASGHGEGEIHLGSIDVAHGGGNLHFVGSYTANAAVSDGDIISATATRKTSGSTYDNTSEFALSISASGASAVLTGSKSVLPLTPGAYALPGNDMIYTITITNEGDGSVDTDTVVIIDAIPSQMTFYNGDHDGPGPSTARVGFSDSATTLSFDPNVDVAFSDAATKPGSFAACSYTPSAGYDPAVTFICFNPKGQMASGNPDPNFSLSFRARID